MECRRKCCEVILQSFSGFVYLNVYRSIGDAFTATNTLLHTTNLSQHGFKAFTELTVDY